MSDWKRPNPNVSANCLFREAIVRAFLEAAERYARIARSKTKTDAHHEDYSKPLEVMWLCRRCHQRRHQEMKSEHRVA